MDIPAAIGHLREAGITVAALAVDLGVHVSTVYRWRAGTRRPNRGNMTALRQLVDDLIGPIQHRRGIACQRQLSRLQAAKDALLTAAELAAEDQLKARLRESLLASGVLRQAGHTRSATAEVDPFALARDMQASALDHIERVMIA